MVPGVSVHLARRWPAHDGYTLPRVVVAFTTTGGLLLGLPLFSWCNFSR